MKTRADDDHGALRERLEQRLRSPQRHRLLHGYPMAPLVPRKAATREADWLDALDASDGRPLLVGVLPHASCNPKVRGCGFCTFPHEKFERDVVTTVIEHVEKEVLSRLDRTPTLRRRKVGGLYFGGGTANLSPPSSFGSLAATLASAFALSEAEVTLEGVPRYFMLHEGKLLDAVEKLGARTRRISMGVQTFDSDWLARMGREAFGDEGVIRDVVLEAKRRGFSTSADMLVNLPGRPMRDAMRDIERAIELGFDQICVYHLVLAADFDVPWAHDRSLLAKVVDNGTACTVWRALRRLLLDAGFLQTTLTNFERRDVVGTPRAFAYEKASFDPARWDALGFGPAAISTFTDPVSRTGVKWINASPSAAYVEAVGASGSAVFQEFVYTPTDLRLMHLTRNFAGLGVDCADYRAFFDSDPEEDFRAELRVLREARLVVRDGDRIELTEDGMFFADSVVGTLANHRAATILANGERSGTRHHMG